MKCAGWKCSFSLVPVLGAILLAAVPLSAQQTPATSATPSTTATSAATLEIPKTVNEKLAQLDKDVKAAQSSADNAWMLVSAALVLMMTGPGLALFYEGLVRRKNTLAFMTQSFALMALITVMWALVGYSLCFGGNGPVIGGFEHAFLRGVGADPNPDYAGTIPQMTFMVYQNHARFDYRRNRGTDEIQRHGPLPDALVPGGLRAAGAHGVGQGRVTERFARRKISDAGFCRRYGCAHFFGRFRAGVRALSRQTHRISEAADASA
jgi:hypothetical protein